MIRVFLFLLLAGFVAASAARAEEPKTPASAKEVEKSEREKQLEILRRDLKSSRDRETRLRAEIDQIKNDRAKFSKDLVDTAARIRDTETKSAAAEKRLEPLDLREAEIKKSLDDRRAVLSDVLAALQKIGTRPAPALILRPDDALESVRAAILLGALVPELRARAEKLAADLSELANVRRDIAKERDNLVRNRAALEEDRSRISALIDERQRQFAVNQKAIEEERARAVALAKQAETLQDLVTRLQKEITAAAGAETLPFAQARGKLHLPVAGAILRNFGAANDAGGVEKGLSIATGPGAQVNAPAAGRVVFAGTFRNYGQLLIINVGGGYHILLAGMERITVDLGQSIAAGEPVAVMGSDPRMSASTTGFSEPVLYVEFRKDGNSIDPAPWWAATEEEKVRG